MVHLHIYPSSEYDQEISQSNKADKPNGTVRKSDSMDPGPEVIKLFSCSTQLSTKFILLINVKMPIIVGILTFISMLNTTSERLRARNFFICRYFSFYEQLKFRAQLS